MKKQLLLSALISLTMGCDSANLSNDIDNSSGNNTEESGDSGGTTGNGDVDGPGDTTDNGDVDGSGDNADTGENDNLRTLVGLLKIEPNSANADFSRALFGQLDPAQTAGDIESSFAPTVDVCEVEISDPSDSDDGYSPSMPINGQETELLSAGENVIVSSSGGTYATLNREYVDSKPFYKTDVELMGAAPTGLTVDITGDIFPAFSDMAINDVPALKMIAPVGDQEITATTWFTWEANNVFRSVFELNSGGIGPNNETVQISCTIVDDGSFTFPQEVVDVIGTDYVADWASYLRIAYNVVETDDAIMFTANSVRSTD